MIIDWAIEERGIHRGEWLVSAANEASIAVARRLGTTKDGVLRESSPYPGKRHDIEVWSVLAPERRAGRQDTAASGVPAPGPSCEDPAVAAQFIDAYAGSGVFWSSSTRLLDGFKLLRLPAHPPARVRVVARLQARSRWRRRARTSLRWRSEPRAVGRRRRRPSRWPHAQKAKAWARVGDRRQVEVALDQGRKILESLPVPDNLDNHVNIDPLKYDCYSMDAYRILGENDRAELYASEVIRAHTSADGEKLAPMRISEARLTLGVIAARRGDVEQAVGYGRRSLQAERRSVPHLIMSSRELVRGRQRACRPAGGACVLG
ncbi:GNAT family N-acetyltransferase [Nonomuraea sp. NPDC051941]|uniref:GNAT family N-acetyltransferase n=1 Tax=Nonomuraea sp. NPDC051941 TaxID=3364373 RepID=UPI0037C5E022